MIRGSMPSGRSPRRWWIACAALVLLACGCARVDDAAVRAALKKQIGRGVRLFQRPTVDVDDIQPLARRFYRERGHRPAWVGARGPTGDARELVRAIDEAPREGLDPRVYRIEGVRAAIAEVDPGLLGAAPDARKLAALDVLLTRTFLRYAAHRASGQVDPKRLPADWHVSRRKADLLGTLKHALERHQVRRALDELPPADPRYARLRDALERYREIARHGGWEPLPKERTLRRGQRGAAVAALRERLAASGDLPSASPAGPVFDAATERAVRSFQARHGLEVDGRIGADDLAALDVPVERRIRQIELNLERWRWLELPFGERYMIVNIPSFSLDVIEGNQSVLAMRVVVGAQLSRTPMFSDEITYLVLNPAWTLPAGIAANEVLPALRQDPSYLERRSIRVFEGEGQAAHEVDPARVDWSEVSPEDLPYTFRQDPGPGNPVGRIKFMCPNQFDVYLHDTPAGHLFDARARDFSHGCVRVEKPLDLAEYLLRGRKGWGLEAIQVALESSRDSLVGVPHPIPVHLLYWTAWVDGQGAVQFREDIYGLDRVLDRALGRALPTARGTPRSAWAPRSSTLAVGSQPHRP